MQRRARSVYGLVDPRSGSVRYVGMARDPVARLDGHRRSPSRLVGAWFAELAAEGLEPSMVVLAVVPEEDAAEREAQWIVALNRTGEALLNVAGCRPQSGPTVVVTMRLPEEQWAEIDARAVARGQTRSAFLREMLEDLQRRVEAGEDVLAGVAHASR